METEAIECYYCACGEKLLRVKTSVLDEKSGIIGMKSKIFGFIPNDTLQPGQYPIDNPSNWTVTLQDKANDEYDDEDNGDEEEEDDHDEEMDIEDGISLNFLEKIPSKLVNRY